MKSEEELEEDGKAAGTNPAWWRRLTDDDMISLEYDMPHTSTLHIEIHYSLMLRPPHCFRGYAAFALVCKLIFASVLKSVWCTCANYLFMPSPALAFSLQAFGRTRISPIRAAGR